MQHRSAIEIRKAPWLQQGLTLIEVLVALLVLSIGLAGMAAMHLSALKNASSSYYRSLASTIALDYEERLWLESATAPATDLDADGCPKTDAIRNELVAAWTSDQPAWDWASGQRATLPGLTVRLGQSNKTVTDPGPDPAVPSTWIELPITVGWTDNRFDDETAGTPSTSDEFGYTVRVLCLQPAPAP